MIASYMLPQFLESLKPNFGRVVIDDRVGRQGHNAGSDIV